MINGNKLQLICTFFFLCEVESSSMENYSLYKIARMNRKRTIENRKRDKNDTRLSKSNF